HAAAGSDLSAPVTADRPDPRIHITADRLISHPSENQAEFIGQVLVRQGETQITADRLKIHFSGTSAAPDASAAQSLEKLVATGNVEIKFDNRLAVA
ncbi:LptA/OstA family protein, partial [Flavihumibacter cheonanensis]|uniref:LptA/OstA family protein n=1 Tax=Flavihumibacter cheonanensis TaxID=1442385 RepID=UPI001EF774A3